MPYLIIFCQKQFFKTNLRNFHIRYYDENNDDDDPDDDPDDDDYDVFYKFTILDITNVSCFFLFLYS